MDSHIHHHPQEHRLEPLLVHRQAKEDHLDKLLRQHLLRQVWRQAKGIRVINQQNWFLSVVPERRTGECGQQEL